MKLFWTPASPFTRKVVVTAQTLGLWDQIEIMPTTWPLEWGYSTVRFTPGLAEANPAARIPTLITDAGDALGDSTLICQHLESLATTTTIIAADPWRMWSLYAIADGLLEAQVAMRAEFLRSQDTQSPGYLNKQRDRIARCFDALESRADELAVTGANPDLAHFTAGIACSYQDWRDWLDDFRTGRPRLAAWYDDFATRALMQETEPQETPEA
ncbi:MAG: glutathione S-transferase [Alphaproteobacteria bacterium]|jgi:glutathione S-transferase